MNNIRKKTPKEFHTFVAFFAVTGIRLVFFLAVLDIFKDKSVNLTVKNKKWWNKMADQKLNLNINLGEIQYLGANS